MICHLFVITIPIDFDRKALDPGLLAVAMGFSLLLGLFLPLLCLAYGREQKICIYCPQVIHTQGEIFQAIWSRQNYRLVSFIFCLPSLGGISLWVCCTLCLHQLLSPAAYIPLGVPMGREPHPWWPRQSDWSLLPGDHLRPQRASRDAANTGSFGLEGHNS